MIGWWRWMIAVRLPVLLSAGFCHGSERHLKSAGATVGDEEQTLMCATAYHECPLMQSKVSADGSG